MQHQQKYRVLDPTKIGMTRDVIEAIDRESFMQCGLSFPELAVEQPLGAYSLVREAYESQPQDKPPMPEAAVLPKLSVYSVTRYTGLRGLVRAIRARPIEEANHFATIIFDGGDDGTLQSISSIGAQEGTVVPLRKPDDSLGSNLSKAA